MGVHNACGDHALMSYDPGKKTKSCRGYGTDYRITDCLAVWSTYVVVDSLIV